MDGRKKLFFLRKLLNHLRDLGIFSIDKWEKKRKKGRKGEKRLKKEKKGGQKKREKSIMGKKTESYTEGGHTIYFPPVSTVLGGKNIVLEKGGGGEFDFSRNYIPLAHPKQ